MADLRDARQLAETTGIKLNAVDWFRATWRDLDPLPLPEPAEQEEEQQQEWQTCSPQEYLQRGLERDSLLHAKNFGYHIVPYLPRGERTLLRDIVRAALSGAQFPVSYAVRLPAVFLFAAYLGVHDSLEALVRSWPDNAFGKQAYRSRDVVIRRPYELIMGIGDPDAMIFHIRRLKLPIRDPETIRAWLANTELRALDVVQRCILTERSSRKAAAMTATLGLASSPSVVPYMLEMMARSSGGNVARKWLDQHPQETLSSLVTLAEGRDKISAYTRDYLLGLAYAGQMTLIKRYAGPKLAEILSARTVSVPHFDADTTPDWLQAFVRTLRRLSRADTTRTVPVQRLPPLVIAGYALNTELVQAVLLAVWLSRSQNSEAKAGADAFVQALKVHVEQPTLDAFAWALVEGWLDAGAPAREKWLLCALGLFGSQRLLLKFYPLLLAWTKGKSKKRFQIGLDCLAEIGSDVALMVLLRLQQTVARKRYNLLIRGRIQKIAQARRLTEDQLLERMVPDCGLDSSGSHRFDYGGRRFRLMLRDDLEPILLDEAGKPHRNLPAILKRDDAAKAKGANEDWQVLRRQLHDVKMTQTQRLERQMVNQWMWAWPDFEQFFLRHPVMRTMARTLVWGCYTPDLSLAQTFRVNADLTFSDAQDRPCQPIRSLSIGMIHPMHLSETERSAWGQFLGDYDIIQPFAQVGRDTYTLTGEEIASKRLLRFAESATHVLSLNAALLKLSWDYQWGPARYFSGFDIAAELSTESVAGNNQRQVKMGYVQFYKPDSSPRPARANERIPLTDVPPLVVSEVIRDLSLAFKR